MVEQHVPIIDLKHLDARDESAKRALGHAVDQALTQIGFFIVTGHGVDWSSVERTDAVCRRFFELPDEVKKKVANQGTPFRGYVGYGGENLSFTEDRASPPDWKENFVMGRSDLSDPYFHRADFHGAFKPNVWPAEMPELRVEMERYYAAMEALTEHLMQALATALELEPNFFRDKLDRHDSTLRAAYYPHQCHLPAQGQLRAGAHTDYGAITVLKVDESTGGLQVRTRAGEWIDVPVVEQGLVVNIGDLMMTWTNDRWLSNMHRVANPVPGSGGPTDRQSLVYFANCNPDALIECLPTCRGPGNSVRHEPITAGEHRRLKIAKSTEMQR